ncbi:MAG: hypothetical protein CL932_06710 [Deltaproteobacteria bacterium]|nr:hypothetical protein [Deltaproteobacteria bacterium]
MFCHCVGIIQQDVPKQKRNFLKRDITRIFMCKRSDAGRNRTPSDGLWLIEQPGVFTPDPTMLTHRLCCALRALCGGSPAPAYAQPSLCDAFAVRLVTFITKGLSEGDDWGVNTLALCASYAIDFAERTGHTVLLGSRLGLEGILGTGAKRLK